MQISFNSNNLTNSTDTSYSMDDLMRSSQLFNKNNQKDLQLYIAQYDFDARGENQLTVKKGEVIRMIAFNQNGEWCEVQKQDGQIGWIPTSYAQPLHSLEKFSWYHGPIDRNRGK